MMLLSLLACGTDGPAPETGKDTGQGDSPGGESGETSETAETGDTDDSGTTSETVFEFDGPVPKNVLFLSLDTVRRDQIGYFTGLDTTPNLDAVMAQSVVLEDHRSCSTWTAPSMLCIYTGLRPWEEGYFPTQIYETEGGDPDVPWIPDDIHTLTEDFRDSGYNTLLVTANGVYSDRLGGGLANGFDEVRLPLWYPAPDVAEKGALAASEMIADGRPWFLGVHFIDPHHPYKAPPEYATDEATLGPFRWDVGDEHEIEEIEADWNSYDDATRAEAYNYLLTVYRAELRYWDNTFADFWTGLDEMGALDDTLVVFFADHGEQFAEHGAFHHGVSLYESENRGVFFFWAKNLRARSWTGPTSHEDIAPTLNDIYGFPVDPTHTGLKIGTAPADRTEIKFNYIWKWNEPYIAVKKGDYKLIYYWTGEKHFQDLAADPDEETNYYSPSDENVLAYWDLLQPEIDKIQAQWPTLVPTDVGP